MATQSALTPGPSPASGRGEELLLPSPAPVGQEPGVRVAEEGT